MLIVEPCGARTSCDVEEGGGTRFTQLNLTVGAKTGRALFWPSVLDGDPSAVKTHSDSRTTHEARALARRRHSRIVQLS